eukprot:m51a1_g10669 hypothetical protein (107) ;mRNA; f:14182-14692
MVMYGAALAVFTAYAVLVPAFAAAFPAYARCIVADCRALRQAHALLMLSLGAAFAPQPLLVAQPATAALLVLQTFFACLFVIMTNNLPPRPDAIRLLDPLVWVSWN